VRRAALAALLALAAAPAAAAEERPREEDLFAAPPKPAATVPPLQPGERPGEDAIMAAPLPQPSLREDPLRIGGLLYPRLNVYWLQGVPPSQWILDAPSLVDAYLDVRPNDRLRGFVQGRLLYDVSVNEQSVNIYGLPTTAASVYLDQLWIRFDIARTVFVTAGKQHVKWGTGHFWNPTDYLHLRPLNPLAVFDARVGTTMLKLHVPWEQKGWNFYAMGLLEGPDAVNQLGQVGGAARIEAVFGTLEVGVDGVVQMGSQPRLGVDFSAGIGDFDVYGEAALRWGREVTQWRVVQTPDLAQGQAGTYQAYDPGFAPQAVLGVSRTWKYSDEDTFTLGLEGYYNSVGYTDPVIYPWLIFQQDFLPFYQGRWYAGLYLLLPKPGSWNTTNFVFSTIASICDRTFVSRIDFSIVLLTYLRLESYVAVHYGVRGGEFRFALEAPALPPYTTAPLSVPPPLVDLGLALRLSL
jgi:hypothetical protein